MSNAIIDEVIEVTMDYRWLIKNPNTRPVWIKSFTNEIGRLAQGVGGRVECTYTMFFLPHNNITENRRKYVTYGWIFVDY